MVHRKSRGSTAQVKARMSGGGGSSAPATRNPADVRAGIDAGSLEQTTEAQRTATEAEIETFQKTGVGTTEQRTKTKVVQAAAAELTGTETPAQISQKAGAISQRENLQFQSVKTFLTQSAALKRGETIQPTANRGLVQEEVEKEPEGLTAAENLSLIDAATEKSRTREKGFKERATDFLLGSQFGVVGFKREGGRLGFGVLDPREQRTRQKQALEFTTTKIGKKIQSLDVKQREKAISAATSLVEKPSFTKGVKVIGQSLGFGGTSILSEFSKDPVMTGASFVGGAKVFTSAPKLATAGFTGLTGLEVKRAETPAQKLVVGTTAATTFAAFAALGKTYAGGKKLFVEQFGKTKITGRTEMFSEVTNIDARQKSSSFGLTEGDVKFNYEINLPKKGLTVLAPKRELTFIKSKGGKAIWKQKTFLVEKDLTFPGKKIKFGERKFTDVLSIAEYKGGLNEFTGKFNVRFRDIPKTKIPIEGTARKANLKQFVEFTGKSKGTGTSEQAGEVFFLAGGKVKGGRIKQLNVQEGVRTFKQEVIPKTRVEQMSSKRIDVLELGQYRVEAIKKTTKNINVRPLIKSPIKFPIRKQLETIYAKDPQQLINIYLRRPGKLMTTSEAGFFEAKLESPIIKTKLGREYVIRTAPPTAEKKVSYVIPTTTSITYPVPKSSRTLATKVGASYSTNILKGQKEQAKRFNEVMGTIVNPGKPKVEFKPLGKRGQVVGLEKPITIRQPKQPKLTRANEVTKNLGGVTSRQNLDAAIKGYVSQVRTKPMAFNIPKLRGTPSTRTQPSTRSQPKIDPRIDTRVEPKINIIINPKIETRVEPKIEPRLEPKINLKIQPKIQPRLEPRISTTITTTPPPPPPPFLGFGFPLGKPRKRRKKKDLDRQLQYNPSLVAVEGKIKGKRPGVLTGIEIRPITL